MKACRWNALVLGGAFGILIFVAAATVIIDPFWHYHLPLKGLEYPLKDERYQNDGMARHCSYDAVIIGTSMAQNFKPSEFDAIWGSESIKIGFAGAGYKEIDDTIRRVLRYNDQVRYVLRSLDGNRLIYPAEYDAYEGYPEYLFDDNIFNDVQYLLNKEVVPRTLAVLNYTRAGNVTPSRDEYGSWSQYKTFGREAVLQTCVKSEGFEEEDVLSEEDYKNIRENVGRNVLQTAQDNPEVTFYLFFPPYSICSWDSMVQTKQLNAQLEAEEMAVGMLVGQDNIHVYHFSENIEMVSNLDNYADALHYGEWINSDILEWVHEGEYELTEQNYREYFERIKKLYSEYDYSSLHE